MSFRWHGLGAIALAILLTAPGAILLMKERARQLRTVLPLARAELREASVPELNLPNGPRAIVQRLVDELDRAELEVPRLHDPYVGSMLDRIWRRNHSAFIGSRGSRAALSFQLALTRAVKLEKGSRGRTAVDPKGLRDSRTFGLTEGTIDQREVLFAPPPARFRFTELGRASSLRFAPAVLGEGRVRFEVALQKQGERHSLWSAELEGPTERFVDQELELPVVASTDVLELVTEYVDPGTLAFFGSPELLAARPAPIPYNVVLIVVDAMRPDAIASFHEPSLDARMQSAPVEPLDAWLPRMPEVAPNLDRLAEEGVVFTRAWTAAMWTRPATLALLTGQLPVRLGLPVREFEISAAAERNYYRNPPPLLPRILRAQGLSTIAIVNNMYLSGYYGVGVDTGFERLRDHRYLIRDTAAILKDVEEALARHRRERFFMFVNLNSPHAPYHPPTAELSAIEGAAVRPQNRTIVRYLAEIRKDDRAIGAIIERLAELELLEQTLIVVTADHGETLSEAHDAVAVDVAQGVHSGRYTHLSTMWEETARIPILLRAPPALGLRGRSAARVQLTDIMPTLLELEGLPVPAGLDGRSLVRALRETEHTDRPLLVEGRGASSLMNERFHLISRRPVARRLRTAKGLLEKDHELYDLDHDPGERCDLARLEPERVAALGAMLERLRSVPVETAPPDSVSPLRLTLRFVSGGRALPLEGVLRGALEGVEVLSAEPGKFRVSRGPGELRIEGLTGAEPVGFELLVPEPALLSWSFAIGQSPIQPHQVHGGSLGFVCPALAAGPAGESRCPSALEGTLPHLVANKEVGLFVVASSGSVAAPEPQRSAEAEAEARRAMQAWGYAKNTDTEAGRAAPTSVSSHGQR